jgi:hypothetical protein
VVAAVATTFKADIVQVERSCFDGRPGNGQG